MGNLSHTLIGSRPKLYAVMAILFGLIVVVPIVLAVLKALVVAVIVLIVGLLLLGALVMALLPGRRF